MSIPLCPKCGSRPAYIQDGKYRCMMCSHDYSIQKPVLLKADENISKDITTEKTIKTESEVKEMSLSGKCRNCERDNMSIVSDHLCGACHRSTAGKRKGTPEYEAALAVIKDKIVCREKNKVEAALEQAKENPKPKSKDIIKILEDRRHELMKEVYEINNTLSTLEKYMAA